MTQGKRDRLSAEQRTDMWRRWKAGESLHEIGRAFGKDHGSIQFLLSQHGERRMTFIEVADLRIQPNLAQQAPAANTQNDFLLQPHLCIATIELAGDTAMRGAIGEVVRI